MSTLYGEKVLNLVLGGGGIKGIAYAGAFNVAEKRGYHWGNIAGVSAGALAGSYLAAGYTTEEIINIMSQFDFSGIDLKNITKKVPAIKRYYEIKEVLRQVDRYRVTPLYGVKYLYSHSTQQELNLELYRSSLLKTIITYYKNGCLFDGDYLEEWVSEVLLRKGIRTFGDLRSGIPDSVNPNGYKIRMTAVDANRGKVIVLPDDMAFYGINPDNFEVAKAVRMSTSIPFVFKPVEIKKIVNNNTKVYNIVDGGVLDKLPYWLIDDESSYPKTVCFTLDGGKKKFNLATPLGMLKDLIVSVHNIGVPQNVNSNIKYFGKIDTSNVDYLDFNLSNEEKAYLYESGVKTAKNVFNSLEQLCFGKDNIINSNISLSNISLAADEYNIDDTIKDISINAKSIMNENGKLNLKYKRNKKYSICNEQSASILALFILLYLIKKLEKPIFCVNIT